MYISEENIEEWCFRYLEKDLNEEECAFFEKELQTNSVLQKEYALWEKTKLTDVFLGAKPSFNKSIYRFNAQLISMLVEFTAFVSLSVCAMCFIYPAKLPASKIEQEQKTEAIKENKTIIEQKNNPINKIYILRNLEQNSNESVVIHPESSVGDSSLVIHSASEKQDSISPTAKKIMLDTTQSPKDSIERKEKTKTKSPKRKNYNGSRLIPINNDL